MTLKEKLKEIVSRIRDSNLHKDKDPIPTSDIIHRRLCADLEPNQRLLQTYLKLLSESHHIFIVKIVEADERLRIDGIDGYVACEVQILAKLREMAARNLERAYAAQMYQRKQAAQIVKEMLPQARQFNNTPLGNYLNISVMLQQYEHFVATSFAEFSDTWKSTKLDELVRNLDPTAVPDMPEGEPEAGEGETDAVGVASAEGPADASGAPMRAVDHAELARIEEMDRSGKWGEAVDKFGVEFLVRIHLRKYEFDKLKHLVRTKKIAREEDLKYIRDALMKMEGRKTSDPGLVRHQAAMIDLRRAVQMRISSIFNVRRHGAAAPGEEEPY